MPWCPICRNEYKEGYKVCSDCGAPLVQSLEDIDKIEKDIHNHDNIMDLATFAQSETLSGMDDQNAYADIITGKEDFFVEDGPVDKALLPKKDRLTSYQPYVKASERAENYKSSAFALLLVGGLGIIFLILCLTGVINFSLARSIRDVGFISMVIIFVIFIVIGVRSLVEAKTIGEFGDLEDSLTCSISDFFANNHSIATIDKEALFDSEANIPNEEKYFRREQVIRDIIKEKFGELEGPFLDNQVETIFNMIYGEE